MVTVTFVTSVAKEANDKLKRVFDEYFPDGDCPYITDGMVRIILEIVENRACKSAKEGFATQPDKECT